MQTNETSNKLLVTGVFKDRNAVESAYKDAIARGYNPNDINVVMSDDTRKKHFTNADGVVTQLGDKSMEGLAVGGALGGTIVGIASAIAAIGAAVVVPGVGLILVGPLAAGLVGAGAGSIAGGLIGALIGCGIPEERVKEYEKTIKSGGIVMTVRPRSEQDSRNLNSEWRKYNSDL
jgi:uncharacterized membrane protein